MGPGSPARPWPAFLPLGGSAALLLVAASLVSRETFAAAAEQAVHPVAQYPEGQPTVWHALPTGPSPMRSPQVPILLMPSSPAPPLSHPPPGSHATPPVPPIPLLGLLGISAWASLWCGSRRRTHQKPHFLTLSLVAVDPLRGPAEALPPRWSVVDDRHGPLVPGVPHTKTLSSVRLAYTVPPNFRTKQDNCDRSAAQAPLPPTAALVPATEALALWLHEGHTILDIRSHFEAQEGRVRGSNRGTVDIPLFELRVTRHPTALRRAEPCSNEEWLDEVRAIFPRSARVIVMCADGGSRTQQALALLAAEGYHHVFGMKGGYHHWDQLFDRHQRPRPEAVRLRRAAVRPPAVDWGRWRCATPPSEGRDDMEIRHETAVHQLPCCETRCPLCHDGTVSVEEAFAAWAAGDRAILDLRSEWEGREQGRIRGPNRGTVDVPMFHARGVRPSVAGPRRLQPTANGEWLAEVKAIFPPEARIVVMCGDGDSRTRQALALLREEGYRHVVGLRGGYAHWDVLLDRHQRWRGEAARLRWAAAPQEEVSWPDWMPAGSAAEPLAQIAPLPWAPPLTSAMYSVRDAEEDPMATLVRMERCVEEDGDSVDHETASLRFPTLADTTATATHVQAPAGPSQTVVYGAEPPDTAVMAANDPSVADSVAPLAPLQLQPPLPENVIVHTLPLPIWFWLPERPIRRWEDPEVTERPHPVEEGVITTSWEDVEPAIVVLDPLEASAPAFQPEVLFADPEAPPYPGVVVIEADTIDAMRPALWAYPAVEHAPLLHPGSLTLSHTEPKVSVGLEPGLQTLTLNGIGLDRGGRGGSVPGGAWLSVRPPRLTSMEWFAALFPILLGAMLAPFWMQTALAVAAGAGMVLVYAAMMMYALRIEPTIAQDAEGHVRIFFCRFGDPDDRLLPGAVLVNRHATSGLFAGAVVLVLSRTSEGTSGVILNKAVTDAHYEEFGGPALFRKAAKVHRGIGGPVSPNVWATYHMLDSVAGATELCPGVFTGGDAGQLLRAGAGQVKVLHGGCGWGPCQLEGEVEAGLWTYADVPLEQVFGPNAPCLWGKLDEQLALLAVADEQPLAA